VSEIKGNNNVIKGKERNNVSEETYNKRLGDLYERITSTKNIKEVDCNARPNQNGTGKIQ
jgi:hypothetical protein